MSYNYPPKLVSLFTTTLSNSIGASSTDTVTLESTARLEQGSLVTLTIDRVDANGDATLETREVIQGIVSGNTITDLVRGYDGSTAQAHDAGAVVEMVLVGADWNKIVEAVGALNSLITNETPTPISGSTRMFTLEKKPAEHGLLLFYNSSLLKEGVIPEGADASTVQGDYTLDIETHTITLDFEPQPNSTLMATYKLHNTSDGSGGGGGSSGDIDELREAIEQLQAAVQNKVDKQLKTGSASEYKVLSDNNYTDGEKQEVGTIGTLTQNLTLLTQTVSNKADIASIPTKTSDLTNDSGFITDGDIPTKTSDLTNDSNFVSDASYNHTDNNYTNADRSAVANIPTKTSDLTNDSGFITSSSVPTKTSDLTNDSNFVADTSYNHTDNNYTTPEKTKLSGVETGAQVNVIEKITLNGAEQAITNKTVTLTDTTYTAGTNVQINNGVISATDTTYTAGTNVQITDGAISATDTTYQAFTGTDGTAAGTSGLVPAPATTDADKYLKSDGTWASVSGGGGAGTITGVSINGTSIATSGVANIPAATASVYGAVRVIDSTSSTSTSDAASANSVKQAYDHADALIGDVNTILENIIGE